jgi:hypothetical protein
VNEENQMPFSPESTQVLKNFHIIRNQLHVRKINAESKIKLIHLSRYPLGKGPIFENGLIALQKISRFSIIPVSRNILPLKSKMGGKQTATNEKMISQPKLSLLIYHLHTPAAEFARMD